MRAFVKRRSSVQSRLAAPLQSGILEVSDHAPGAPEGGTKRGRGTKTVQSDEPESVTLQKVQEALWAYGGVHVMRNNVGAGKRKGFYVRYGLEVGSADLVCIVAPHGKWLCIECKRPKNSKESEAQTKWLAKMRNYGAVAAVVRSPDEVGPLVELARKASW